MPKKNLKRRHATWMKYISAFHFALKHKFGQSNRVADALNHRQLLLQSLEAKVVGFKILKELYPQDMDFLDKWAAGQVQSQQLYHVKNEHLFHGNCLCIL